MVSAAAAATLQICYYNLNNTLVNNVYKLYLQNIPRQMLPVTHLNMNLLFQRIARFVKCATVCVQEFCMTLQIIVKTALKVN